LLLALSFCILVEMTPRATALAVHHLEQGRERRVRTIPFNLTPIADRLRADDDIVIVEWIMEDVAAWDRQPTPLREMQIAAAADVTTTAVVTVTGVSGVLALENSWIHTKFVATVDEILRTGKELADSDRLIAGQIIEFYVQGGEAAINGVIVRARDVVSYPLNRRYLVLLGERQPENGWGVVSSAPLLVEGERLNAVAPAKSRLSGLTLPEVRQAIRQIP
jgi:hypothetical protein